MDATESLRPLFAKVEGLRPTLESAQLLVHNVEGERTGTAQHAEWIYLVPEEAPLDIGGIQRGPGDATALIRLLNHRLQEERRTVEQVEQVKSANWDLEGGEYRIDDVRTRSGRFLYLEWIRQ